jgi:hypothetical protein
MILLAGTSAYADVIVLLATLTNDHENPDASPTLTSTGEPRPASFGYATFFFNDAMTTLTFTGLISQIDVTGTQTADPNDNLIAAHIHAGPAVTPDTNGPVVWGFFGALNNDINPSDTEFTPFPSPFPVGGEFQSKWDAPEGNNTTLALQLENILNGRAYINFHTVQFPEGELRGNISVAPVPIPEPSTILLLTTSAVVFGARRWRHRAVYSSRNSRCGA